ncbi:MAG: MlaD family protein [Gloeomargarita sp. SKYBB_i_bin120]|nr:MlaD family protein [Gloeomargarita sp. SKYG98]MCS7293111.1 MlaD family protein [Gloeomargarita sp. SKYB120]MDW8178676.1 MlaD family protein [Gloeomargarita sp. SKYBB_i_bin120]
MTSATKPSRRQQEGFLGLFIVMTVLLLAGVWVWVEDVAFNANRYRFQVAFRHAAGLGVGSTVRLRGVEVGRVVAVEPGVNQVLVTVEIHHQGIFIPKKSHFRAQTGGLVGQPSLEISPQADLDVATVNAGPRSPDCDANLLVCQGAQVTGQTSPTFDDLVRSAANLVNQLDNSELVDNMAKLTQSLGDLNQDIRRLTVEARQTLQQVQAAAKQVEQAGTRMATAADTTTAILRENRAALRTSLVRLNRTLETAQSAFTAFRKVATDVDQITGDPRIREDIKNLIRGLGKLLKLTEDMRQQLQALAQENPQGTNPLQ